MEYRKNDMVTLEITDCGVDGEGIGKVDGFTVFVKDAVIGDTVEAKIIKAKKNYGYGRLMKILEPSQQRVEPTCAFAAPCGGCQLQALSYEQQLAFKERKVRGHLERIGGFTEIPMEPIIGADKVFHYRNKAQFPVGMNRDGKIVTGFYAGRTHSIIENRDCPLGVPENKEVLDRVIAAQFPVGMNRDGKIVTGFYAGRTHSIIENRDCPLGVPENKEVLDRVIAHMEQFSIKSYDETSGKGLVRHVLVRKGFYTGELMVCVVINGKSFPKSEQFVERLREIPGMTSISLNVNQEKSNVILGREVKLLWGKPCITDKIGEISYEISPLSFFQVNPEQTEKLYGKALEYADLHGEEDVWDLYCGIGTISLFLAQRARFVRGVEIIPAAIDNAKQNARLNGMTNTEFFVGKAEEVLPGYYEKYEQEHPGENAKADVIVVDPPRKGCDETLLRTMVKMQPKRIVYVSCDSATLARDLKSLCGEGYEIEKVCPVDMFPQTVHVETVVRLVRK